MQYTFYFDQSRCTGCTTCIVACKDWNGIKAGDLRYRKIVTIEDGDNYPDINVTNTVFSCNHCEKPACLAACPVEAISKREKDGIVVNDRDKCIACGACAEACPFGAPHYGNDITEPEKQSTWQAEHPMQKCDFCSSRLDKEQPPICVSSCLVRALDYGTEEEMSKKYPDAQDTIKGFPSDMFSPDGEKLATPTNPSILFKSFTRK